MSTALASLSMLLLSLQSPALHAQDLPAGIQLGMTHQALQQILPGLERVRRPQRLAGGLVGAYRWTVEIAGLSGQQTFFFQGGQLCRVEFFADTREQPDAGSQAYNRIVAWGRETYGPERAARDPGSSYASWTLEETDIYVQSVGNPRASVRLVHKIRQARDASEL